MLVSIMTLEELQQRREERGTIIAKGNQVSQIEENFYTVKSQSGKGEYAIYRVDGEWHCECPDHTYRHVKCKHLYALEISLKMKEQIKKNVTIQEINVSTCSFCHSTHVKKFGIRKNKNGNIQRFLCSDCGKTFSINLGFEKMKHNPKQSCSFWVFTQKHSASAHTVRC